MEDEFVPIRVTIITGFLGTGKTTFLNYLMQKNSDIRYAIIENEYGEQGIDNELIIRHDDSIVELNNGCLCCTLNDNLYDILNELFDRRADFDEIIIEATGIADPTGLAEPFIAHPIIKKHFPLTAVVCLVDAEQVEDQLINTKEAERQIAFSDILLINKIDLVGDEQVGLVETKLRKLNPLATILRGYKDHFPTIAYHRHNDKLEEVLLKSSAQLEVSDTTNRFPVKKPKHHHHHDHTEEINSQTFIFDKPFDFQVLFQQLSVYLTFQATGLYRIKGLVWLADKEEQHVLQSVGKRLDFEPKRAWLANESKKSIVVFIGKQLQREGLERLLIRSVDRSTLKSTIGI